MSPLKAEPLIPGRPGFEKSSLRAAFAIDEQDPHRAHFIMVNASLLIQTVGSLARKIQVMPTLDSERFLTVYRNQSYAGRMNCLRIFRRMCSGPWKRFPKRRPQAVGLAGLGVWVTSPGKVTQTRSKPGEDRHLGPACPPAQAPPPADSFLSPIHVTKGHPRVLSAGDFLLNVTAHVC